MNDIETIVKFMKYASEVFDSEEGQDDCRKVIEAVDSIRRSVNEYHLQIAAVDQLYSEYRMRAALVEAERDALRAKLEVATSGYNEILANGSPKVIARAVLAELSADDVPKEQL